MKKKRRTSREFFEHHREHFERSERVHREWLEQFEARDAAKRKAANPQDKP